MKTDVAILGGGPGGSAAAMFLLRQGIKPLIIEGEKFPRYHIGESMTGAAAKVMRDLGLEDEMMRRAYPVKKGVKVYGTTGNTTWFVPVTQRDENWQLVPSYTWQIRRSDYDKMMLDEARKRGADFLQAKATEPLLNKEDHSVRGVRVKLPDGDMMDVESKVLIDASGQATFLANHHVTGPKYLGAYDKQIAIFSQVDGTVRGDGSSRETDPDNAIIFYQQKYHWAWFIPLDKNVVSVGVVTPSGYFLDKKESKKDYVARELQELNPAIKNYIPDLNFVEDMHVIPNYSYQVRGFTGKGFICLGDAHRFIDPIFSFGLTVTMREAQFAAPIIKDYIDGKKPNSNSHPFADYEKFCEMGADILEDTIDCFWEFPLGFAKYVHFDYKDQMTDMFAGRIYEHQPSQALVGFRKSLKRERNYEMDDYSVPVGSRYHPERAPIWEANSPVETTEDWLGPR
jgi:1H-pyrrole-2-carbonyl-[peptidyl-carrier protein] brominase